MARGDQRGVNEEMEWASLRTRGRNAPTGQRSGHGPLQLGLGRADLMPGKTWSSATAPSPPGDLGRVGHCSLESPYGAFIPLPHPVHTAHAQPGAK